MEPTELVHVASVKGSIAALSIVKKEMHYVYLELGNRQYCTVAIPRGSDDDQAQNGALDGPDHDQSPLKPLFEQSTGAGICCLPGV